MLPKPDSPLYHYCSMDTALKILQNDTLRMSSLFHMNDSLEHKWLFKQAIEYLAVQIRHDTGGDNNPIDKPLYDKLIAEENAIREVDDEGDFIGDTYSGKEVYCVCFSEKSDSLSQWRAYADDGYGVAIGFDVRKFGFGVHLPIPSRCGCLELAKVEYRDGQQVDKLYDAINTIVPIHKPPSAIIDPVDIAYFNLWAVASTCKNVAFHEEEEWRIIYRPFTDDEADLSHQSYKFDFYTKNKMLVPFYDLPVPREPPPQGFKRGPSKAIKRIVLGPNVSTESETALEMLVHERGYHGVKFRRSTASYRS